MSNPYCIEADIKRLTYQAHEFHTTGNGTTIANEKLKLPRYCISQIYIYIHISIAKAFEAQLVMQDFNCSTVNSITIIGILKFIYLDIKCLMLLSLYDGRGSTYVHVTYN